MQRQKENNLTITIMPERYLKSSELVTELLDIEV